MVSLPDWVLGLFLGTVLAIVVAVWLGAIVFFGIVAYQSLRWLLRRLKS